MFSPMSLCVCHFPLETWLYPPIDLILSHTHSFPVPKPIWFFNDPDAFSPSLIMNERRRTHRNIPCYAHSSRTSCSWRTKRQTDFKKNQNKCSWKIDMCNCNVLCLGDETSKQSPHQGRIIRKWTREKTRQEWSKYVQFCESHIKMREHESLSKRSNVSCFQYVLKDVNDNEMKSRRHSYFCFLHNKRCTRRRRRRFPLSLESIDFLSLFTLALHIKKWRWSLWGRGCLGDDVNLRMLWQSIPRSCLSNNHPRTGMWHVFGILIPRVASRLLLW